MFYDVECTLTDGQLGNLSKCSSFKTLSNIADMSAQHGEQGRYDGVSSAGSRAPQQQQEPRHVEDGGGGEEEEAPDEGDLVQGLHPHNTTSEIYPLVTTSAV